MSKEIEIKIPLTDAEYEKIFLEIKDKAEHLKKSDEYFSRYDTREERKKNNEPQVIRIRTEENLDKNQTETFFCLKFKSIENGVEFNSENESLISDANPLRLFFEVAGYKKFFEKKKDAYSYYYQSEVLKNISFHLELEIINGLKYVEIEVTDCDLDAAVIRQELEHYVTQLGLDVTKRDSRSWMEILTEAK